MVSGVDTVDWLRGALVAVVSVIQLGIGVVYATADEPTEQNKALPTSVAAAPADAEPAAAVSSRSVAVTVIALASPCVTFLIGALAIVSKHRITEYRLDMDERHDRRDRDFEARQKAVEVRLALLAKGIPCEHEDCPVVEVATGKRPWDELPPFRRAQCPRADSQSCGMSKEQPE